MSFSKDFNVSNAFAALYLSSNSLSARAGGGVDKQKRKGVDRGRGLKTGKNMWTSFTGGPQQTLMNAGNKYKVRMHI